MPKSAKLICPESRPGMDFLKEDKPLALLSCCGKSLIDHALVELASQGYEHVDLYLSDRPEQLREQIRGGEKWGITVTFHPTKEEVSKEDVSSASKQKAPGEGGENVFVLDRLPLNGSTSLFKDYESLFDQLRKLLTTSGEEQLGMRQLQPGIWTGIGSHIPPDADLKAPCWIGRNVYLSSGVQVGPNAIIEDECLVDKRAIIRDSQIIQRTYVGSDTEIQQSIASGARLLNWKTGNSQEIQDPFLLAQLDLSDPGTPAYSTGILSRLSAALSLLLLLPLSLAIVLLLLLSRKRVFVERIAARPRKSQLLPPHDRFKFMEFNISWTLCRRIPRLWSVAKGEMSWVGNPPITPESAATLETEFDLLWLAAPCGFISLGDCYQSIDPEQHEARTHAAYYSAKRDSKLNSKILASVILSKQP